MTKPKREKKQTKKAADGSPPTTHAPNIEWVKNPDWTWALINYLTDHPLFRKKLFSDSTAEANKEGTVTNHPHDLQLSFLTYANNPSLLQITLRRPYPQVSKAEHNNPGTTKAPIVPRLAKTPSPCLDIAYSQ
ncbi:hypothetical protein K443DRAFT_10782 [Laccaria amethystina LaAM-08-1]|uniref:Uncharacterized protein n=1 Tax=Laccaria amethystina LaAM-08-1 TaxID=1095629 RepID=A0A0C9XEU7_9AGAR|nr:hypothetical protein K443DRAFT_10782 [Laccaria amethystina LaAM-08-1]